MLSFVGSLDIYRFRAWLLMVQRSYQFHPPDTTVDTDRPGYGGTCYSDLPAKTNVPVIAFNEDGDTASKAFSQSASGAQAFAHPIDGWALTSPTIGCPTASASLTSDSESPTAKSSKSSSASSQSPQAGAGSPTPSTTASSDGVSTGAIVGAAIGGCAVLAFLVALVWLILVRRRKNNAVPRDAHQMADDFGGPKTVFRSEGQTQYNSHEVSAYPPEKSEWVPSQLNDGHGAFEMQAASAHEMPAETVGKTGDSKIMGFHAH
jgi:hypothetical protein